MNTELEGLLAEVREVLKELKAQKKVETADLLTMKEAASVLGCSPSTLARLVSCGAVLTVDLGDKKKISRGEIARVCREGAPFKKEPQKARGVRAPRSKAVVQSEAEKVLAALRKRR